ncbi:hypothetical protein ACJX0J_038237, partial [Zea mays]
MICHKLVELQDKNIIKSQDLFLLSETTQYNSFYKVISIFIFANKLLLLKNDIKGTLTSATMILIGIRAVRGMQILLNTRLKPIASTYEIFYSLHDMGINVGDSLRDNEMSNMHHVTLYISYGKTTVNFGKKMMSYVNYEKTTVAAAASYNHLITKNYINIEALYKKNIPHLTIIQPNLKEVYHESTPSSSLTHVACCRFHVIINISQVYDTALAHYRHPNSSGPPQHLFYLNQNNIYHLHVANIWVVKTIILGGNDNSKSIEKYMFTPFAYHGDSFSFFLIAKVGTMKHIWFFLPICDLTFFVFFVPHLCVFLKHICSFWHVLHTSLYIALTFFSSIFPTCVGCGQDVFLTRMTKETMFFLCGLMNLMLFRGIMAVQEHVFISYWILYVPHESTPSSSLTHVACCRFHVIINISQVYDTALAHYRHPNSSGPPQHLFYLNQNNIYHLHVANIWVVKTIILGGNDNSKSMCMFTPFAYHGDSFSFFLIAKVGTMKHIWFFLPICDLTFFVFFVPHLCVFLKHICSFWHVLHTSLYIALTFFSSIFPTCVGCGQDVFLTRMTKETMFFLCGL